MTRSFLIELVSHLIEIQGRHNANVVQELTSRPIKYENVDLNNLITVISSTMDHFLQILAIESFTAFHR